MKKTKLNIVEQSVKTTATQQVNGATLRFMYEQLNGQPPVAVAFSVTKGQSSHTYGGANMEGVVSSTGHFEVRNNSFEVSDIDLYKVIHQTANSLLHPEAAEAEVQAEEVNPQSDDKGM